MTFLLSCGVSCHVDGWLASSPLMHERINMLEVRPREAPVPAADLGSTAGTFPAPCCSQQPPPDPVDSGVIGAPTLTVAAHAARDPPLLLSKDNASDDRRGRGRRPRSMGAVPS